MVFGPRVFEVKTTDKPDDLTKRDAQRERTRAAIVEAGTQLFAERGFEGTSMPAITALSGARGSLILYHFNSKEGLWKACVDDIFAKVSAFIDAREPRIAAARGMDYFREAVAAHIGAAAANPTYHRILFREAMQGGERLEWLVEKHLRPMSERIVAVIRNAQDAGILPRGVDPMHLKFLTSGLFTLPITLAPEYRLMTGTEPLDEAFVERHVEACLQLLSNAAAGPDWMEGATV